MAALTIQAGSQILLAYSRKFAAEIAQKMRVGLVTESNIRSVYCDRTYVAPNMTTTEVTQPYQKAWTAKGVAAMNETSYSLQKGKFDLEFDEDDLEQWVNSYNPNADESGLGRKRDDWEWPRFVFEQFIIPKIVEEMELEQAFTGVYAAPTPGTAGAASAVCDGLKTVLAAQIASGKIPAGNVLTTGAITAATIVDKINIVLDGLPSAYRLKVGKMYVSPTLWSWYIRKYAANSNGNSMGVTGINALNTEAIVDGSSLRLVPLPSMAASQRIIVDFDSNTIVGKRLGRADVPVPVWEPDTRKLKCFSEYFRFYGFDRPFDVFCNDVV